MQKGNVYGNDFMHITFFRPERPKEETDAEGNRPYYGKYDRQGK